MTDEQFGPWLDAVDERMQSELDCEEPELPVKIMPHLYLGDAIAAEDVEGLKALGITHVLNAAHELECASQYAALGIKHHVLGGEDAREYDMAQHVPVARAFIEAARAEGGKVLVHCMAGVNRSGFLAAVELMLHEQLPVLHTLTRCFEARGLVLINRGFRLQLLRLAEQHRLLGCVGELPSEY